MEAEPSSPRKILVTDFDGTMTRRDFYQLVLERVPPGTPDFWRQYLDGELTHFEAINAVFAAYRPGEATLISLTRRMEIDPGLHEAITGLRTAGWEVVVASAGCAWYIERLLRESQVSIEIYANPGVVQAGRLLMTLPRGSPFFAMETGINKRGVIQKALATHSIVAFAGDGPPDLEPALLINENLRFATGYLAGELTRRGEPFRPFERWSEVARALISESEVTS